MTGQQVQINLADIIKATRPNSMGVSEKLWHYFVNLKEFYYRRSARSEY